MDTSWQYIISIGILLFIICLISMVISFFNSRKQDRGYFDYLFTDTIRGQETYSKSLSRVGVVIICIGLVIALIIFIHNIIFK